MVIAQSKDQGPAIIATAFRAEPARISNRVAVKRDWQLGVTNEAALLAWRTDGAA